ncbi:OmpA family protein [Desulfobaculum bizertense]|uniref:OmpA-OmpF porin, OOP family n=1 Tax=Desulfobaculum bizertense DSM 18034 TaxID=1121442 RepID=A0A1T4WPI6_9BACT|nr:OmpA family protein [Desulfobaculum bizertense]UIJ39341.1 OmpA family protein [Desulfobaculum bizertense]SKA78778.1 OmpA-OmpF porin, OOP family [Desulfobaculum bizertense DSM 18034]
MIRMRMKSLVTLAFVGVFLMCIASVASARVELVPKADSFTLFQDYSGSMAMKHQDLGEEKIVLAKHFLQRFNENVPDRDYEARFYTSSPYKWMLGGKYDRDIMGRTIDKLNTGYTVSNRLTALGRDMGKLDSAITDMKKKNAIILVSDGENNLGMDPVEEARQLYANHPGEMCIHVVSFADTEEGQKTLDDIAALNPCSVSVYGPDLLCNDDAMKDFVKRVFFDEVMVDDEEVIPLRINFDFDSAKIRPDMMPILDEAAELIKKHEGMAGVILEGHTCNIGTEEYNMGLSQRRADSVKKYLVDHGVDGNMLSTKAYGESMPKYDNNTKEGRRLNRRVEIVFE